MILAKPAGPDRLDALQYEERKVLLCTNSDWWWDKGSENGFINNSRCHFKNGKRTIFPAGRSTVGNMNDMEFKLANFKQEELSETVELGGREVNFTLGNYIEKYKLTRIRIYLPTRERNKFRELLGKLQTKRQSVRQEEQQPPVVVVKDGEYDSSFDDDRHEKALPLEIPDQFGTNNAFSEDHVISAKGLS